MASEKDLDVIGTLGVLLEAKRNKLIPLVRAPLESILKTNFRISPKIIQRLLDDAAEL